MNRNLQKKFPEYFKNFEFPPGTDERELLVFRACKTKKIDAIKSIFFHMVYFCNVGLLFAIAPVAISISDSIYIAVLNNGAIAYPNSTITKLLYCSHAVRYYNKCSTIFL